MRRRALLRRVAGTGLLGASGVVGSAAAAPGGHPTAEPGGTPGETPTGTGPAPHSRLHVPDATEAVVGPDGTTVYVATKTGMSVVSVADPHEPSVLATVEDRMADAEDGPLGGIQDVKVDGDRVILVGPAHPGSSPRGMVVFDVSTPAEPQQVGVHRTTFPIHNAYLQDGVAYLAGNGAPGNPLVTVDVTEEPTELGRWSIFEHDQGWETVPRDLRTLHDIWVQGDLAYLAHWDAGTYVVDVSDPAAPEFVSRVRGRDPDDLPTQPRAAVLTEAIEVPGNDHYVATNEDGTLLGVGAEAWDYGGGDEAATPGGIELYDVSDPTTPERLGFVDPPPSDDESYTGTWTTSHNFDIVGDYLYSSWYQGGVRIHDVSDPGDPVEAYAWRDADVARFWTAQLAVPGMSFVASSMGVGRQPEEGTPTESAPALYVFPDVVHEPPDSTPTPVPDVTGVLGPGFGALGATGAAAGALGLGAWRARRRRDEG